MGDDPKPKDSLAPFFPSEVPDLRGNGSRWVALALAALLLFGAVTGVLWLLFP